MFVEMYNVYMGKAMRGEDERSELHTPASMATPKSYKIHIVKLTRNLVPPSQLIGTPSHKLALALEKSKCIKNLQTLTSYLKTILGFPHTGKGGAMNSSPDLTP